MNVSSPNPFSQQPTAKGQSDPNVKKIQEALGIDKERLEKLADVVNITINNFKKANEAQKSLTKSILGNVPAIIKLGSAALAGAALGRSKGILAGAVGGAAAGEALTGSRVGTAVGEATGAAGGVIKLLDKIMDIAGAAMPAGLDLIGDTIKEVAASFGQYLAPVIPVIAAYIKTLGEIFLEALAPALEMVPELLVTTLIPMLKMWIRVMLGLGAVITVIIAGVVAIGSAFADLVGGIAKLVGANDTAKAADRASVSMMKFTNKLGDAAGQMWNAATDGDMVDKKFNKNLKDQVNRQQRGVSDAMGTPQFTNIADVWKKVQLEAFRNPHELEMLNLNRKGLENSGKMVQLLEKNNDLTGNQKPAFNNKK